MILLLQLFGKYNEKIAICGLENVYIFTYVKCNHGVLYFGYGSWWSWEGLGRCCILEREIEEVACSLSLCMCVS